MKQRQLTPLGKKIVKRLVDMDKTQVWLCDQLGIQKTYLNKILHGERSGQKYLAKIYDALDLNEDEQQTA
ncbi:MULTISPECIES: transcriptional regulator [Lysinibacillus]|uniref:transcriptional regulator n=1 Tax=Lysinibacillus TaxID=400634 RepID=UPI00289F5448|nr:MULTISPECIES: transcriptional regulator [Lysinibacillus]MED3799985.1 transcriptional regulator [Lysinibacillus capsici]